MLEVVDAAMVNVQHKVHNPAGAERPAFGIGLRKAKSRCHLLADVTQSHASGHL